MLEQFDIKKNNVFMTCVVATMSSGKSTFINAIIGDEVLPEKNEACTARIMAVIDSDLANEERVHIIRSDGTKEICKITGRDTMEEINNDDSVSEFLVETDIKDIRNTSKALLLIDTPGVNNSADERHGERTHNLLENMRKGLIIYVLNATQLSINDDAILLQSVVEHLNNNPDINIFFVLNKIDEVVKEKGPMGIKDAVSDVVSYLNENGIQKPIIYPLSAKAAKLLKMAYHKKDMTKREKRFLEDAYQEYKPSENDMLSFAMSNIESEEAFEIADEEVSAGELRRAIENTGIIAIERKIQDFMQNEENNYVPRVVLKPEFSKELKEKFHNQIEDITREISDEDESLFADVIDDIRETGENPAEISRSQSFEKDKSNTELLQNNIVKVIIKDAQKEAKFIRKSLSENILVSTAFSKNVFYIPKREGFEHATVKDFYCISSDKIHWGEIDFSEILSKDGDKSFYLYNPQTDFMTNVGEDINDLIGVLDLQLPFSLLFIGDIQEKISLSIPEALELLGQIKNRQKQDKEEKERLDNRLERTYKGVEFKSISEKETAQKKEKELEKACQNLDGLTHRQLFDMKTEVESYPEKIFAIFSDPLLSALRRAEEHELPLWLEKIKSISGIQELENLQRKFEEEKYSTDVNKTFEIKLNDARLSCLIRDAERLAGECQEKNKEEKWKVYDRIDSINIPKEIKNKYLTEVAEQIASDEEKELWKICEEMRTTSSDDNSYAIERISRGRYTAANSVKYLMKARLINEKKIKAEIDLLVSKIDNIQEDALYKIEDILAKKDVPDRLKYEAENKLKNRRIKIDMIKLMKICNEFNFLKPIDIQNIRKKAESIKVDRKCKKLYLDRLNRRENAIAVARMSQYACYFKQLTDQAHLKAAEYSIGIFSGVYESALYKFRSAFNEKSVYIMPFVIISQPCYVALTENFVYFKSYSRLGRVLAKSVNKYDSVKQKDGWAIVIIDNAGGFILLDGRYGDKKEAKKLIGCLNKVLTAQLNPAIVSTFNPYQYKVNPITNKDIENLYNKTPFGFAYYYKKWSNGIIAMKKVGIVIGNQSIYLQTQDNSMKEINIKNIFKVTHSEDFSELIFITGDNQSMRAKVHILDGVCKYENALNEYIRTFQFFYGNEYETT